MHPAPSRGDGSCRKSCGRSAARNLSSATGIGIKPLPRTAAGFYASLREAPRAAGSVDPEIKGKTKSVRGLWAALTLSVSKSPITIDIVLLRMGGRSAARQSAADFARCGTYACTARFGVGVDAPIFGATEPRDARLRLETSLRASAASTADCRAVICGNSRLPGGPMAEASATSTAKCTRCRTPS